MGEYVSDSFFMALQVQLDRIEKGMNALAKATLAPDDPFFAPPSDDPFAAPPIAPPGEWTPAMVAAFNGPSGSAWCACRTRYACTDPNCNGRKD